MLTREGILSIVTKPTKVTVPHIGEMYLRLLSEAEAVEVSAAASDNTARARFAALCLCDASGQRLFGDGDAAEIAKLPYVAVKSIFEHGLKLNGLEADEEEEDAGKN